MNFDTGHSKLKKQKLLLPSGNYISYLDEGSGKDCLLFIHGLAGMADVWYYQIKELSKTRRCIALDLPGCGLSDPLNNYTMPVYCQVVVEVIHALNLKNVIPVGHSMGGQVAIHLALIHADKFNKLILIAPAGFEKFSKIEVEVLSHLTGLGGMFLAHENQFGNFLRQSFYKYDKSAINMVDHLLQKLHESDKAHWRKMVSQCIKMMLNESTFNQLENLTQQVLVIFGEKDLMIPNVFIHPLTTKRIAEVACSRIKNCTLNMVSMAGHFVFFEKHQQTNLSIERFVEYTVKPGC